MSSVIAAAMVATSAIIFFGCSSPDRSPNVLFISVDTLRPDRLSYAGHMRSTSPTIDALAEEGVVFTNCRSVAGWTLPSMATLLTGRYPRDHGATDFHWSMSDRLPTMASLLKERGYDTRGYVSHVILKPEYGLAEGFMSYDFSVLNVGDPHAVSTANELTDLVTSDIKDIEEPFFLWVHYFDPHFAYLRHGKWRAFGDTEIDRYDQEIAHTDRQIGRLLGYLKKRNFYDNTIVIFTSDHGEEFGEHDWKYHYTLYDEVLRVPLVIRAPSLEPSVNTSGVEQIDVLPTLMSMLNIAPDEGAALPGRDLLAPGADEPAEKPLFFERDRPPPYNQRGIVHGRYKLVIIERTDINKIPARSRGTFVEITHIEPGIYMYDLQEDPEEQRNIYSEDDPRALQLLVTLAEHFANETTAVREVQIDDSLREKLRSLGYIR